MPLHVPVVIICIDTRVAVANRPGSDNDGFERQYVDGFAVYVGEWNRPPVHPYAYREWNGQNSAFFSWQGLQSDSNVVISELSRPRGSTALTRMTHTAFHVFQPNLGITGRHAPMAGTPALTLSYMLEMNALIEAISSEGEAKFEAARDALSIRHARREAFRTSDRENNVLSAEGTATYMELRLHFSRDEIVVMIQTWPDEFFVRAEKCILGRHGSIAGAYDYLGGALWGIVLDELGVIWRPYFTQDSDFGMFLQEALGIEPIPLDEINLERFGYSVIAEWANS